MKKTNCYCVTCSIREGEPFVAYKLSTESVNTLNKNISGDLVLPCPECEKISVNPLISRKQIIGQIKQKRKTKKLRWEDFTDTEVERL